VTGAAPAWHGRFAGPHESPGFLLWRDFMRWQRGQNAALRPLGLTQPQFAVLAVCGWMTRGGGTTTQAEIVDVVGLDPMHVSQVAKRLEADGLIRRTAGTSDRREKRIALTQRGEDVLGRAVPVVEACDAAFFAARTAGRAAR
jgi:DNA-binding MarR family transcriptional regulator